MLDFVFQEPCTVHSRLRSPQLLAIITAHVCASTVKTSVTNWMPAACDVDNVAQIIGWPVFQSLPDSRSNCGQCCYQGVLWLYVKDFSLIRDKFAKQLQVLDKYSKQVTLYQAILAAKFLNLKMSWWKCQDTRMIQIGFELHFISLVYQEFVLLCALVDMHYIFKLRLLTTKGLWTTALKSNFSNQF